MNEAFQIERNFMLGQQVRAYSKRWTPDGWEPVEELATVVNPCVTDDPVYAGDVEIKIDGVLNRTFVSPESLEPVSAAATYSDYAEPGERA